MNGINKVLLVGEVTEAGPKISWNDAGAPCTTFTLQIEEAGRDSKSYKLFIPVEVFSTHAEWVAEHLHAGDPVVIDGKLKWRSSLDKQGVKSGKLVVLGWQVSLLGPRPHAVTTN
jgi:single-stranded DNA-binding protein